MLVTGCLTASSDTNPGEEILLLLLTLMQMVTRLYVASGTLQQNCPITAVAFFLQCRRTTLWPLFL